MKLNKDKPLPCPQEGCDRVIVEMWPEKSKEKGGKMRFFIACDNDPPHIFEVLSTKMDKDVRR